MTLRPRYQWLLLAAVVLGVFYPALFGGYSPVDDLKVLNRLSNLEHLDFYTLFFRTQGYYYRPLTASTFYLDHLLWGSEALFLHVENVLLHLCNASLVFVIARWLCRKATRLPSWFPLLWAFLFALHPVNVEAVCWISGRYDLLATTFVLISVWLLLWALSGASVWRMLPSLLFALLGCLAKETALFFFGGAVCIIYAHARVRGNSALRSLRLALPGMLLWSTGAMVYLLIRRWGLSGHDSGVGTVLKSVGATGGAAAWADQLRIAVKVSGFYFKKIFFPYPLNFAITEISHVYLLAGILLIVLCAWLAWRADLSAAFFLGSMLAGSSALLVVFGKMAWTLVAERYMYLPSALFILGWAAWFAACRPTKYFVWLKLVVVCFAMVWAGMTIQRAQLWSDQVALAEDTVAKSPNFLPARKDLANYYLALGEKEKGQRLLESVIHTAGSTNLVAADISMAQQLTTDGRLDEAHHLLSDALDNPGKRYVDVANAMLKLNQQRLARASDAESKTEIHRENVQLFEKLMQRTPDPFFEYQLAKEYLAMNEVKRATALFEAAYRKAPPSAHYKEPARKLAEKLAAGQHD